MRKKDKKEKVGESPPKGLFESIFKGRKNVVYHRLSKRTIDEKQKDRVEGVEKKRELGFRHFGGERRWGVSHNLEFVFFFFFFFFFCWGCWGGFFSCLVLFCLVLFSVFVFCFVCLFLYLKALVLTLPLLSSSLFRFFLLSRGDKVVDSLERQWAAFRTAVSSKCPASHVFFFFFSPLSFSYLLFFSPPLQTTVLLKKFAYLFNPKYQQWNSEFAPGGLSETSLTGARRMKAVPVLDEEVARLVETI